MTTEDLIQAQNGSPRVSELLRRYDCGPIPFSGTENALYERHLVFDRAIDPKVATARERFEAFAHSVRDILAQRWVLTKRTYEKENAKRIYYLSMEFLIGRSSVNNVTNLLLDPLVQHLRLFTTRRVFHHRLCLHLSVSLKFWEGQAYRQMADTVAPPASEGLPALPETADLVAGSGVAAPTAPRKRGPKPDHDTAVRVADVVARIAADGDWRSNLDDICDALDEEHIPVPRTWRRNRECTQWSLCNDRDLIVKAIGYRLGQARSRKKDTPETLS